MRFLPSAAVANDMKKEKQRKLPNKTNDRNFDENDEKRKIIAHIFHVQSQMRKNKHMIVVTSLVLIMIGNYILLISNYRAVLYQDFKTTAPFHSHMTWAANQFLLTPFSARFQKCQIVFRCLFSLGLATI